MIGQLVAGHSLLHLISHPVSYQWFILAALTLLTGTFTVRIPGIRARLSVSESFVFASVLVFGPAAGTITSLLDVLIISLRLGHYGHEAIRVVFNASVAVLSTWTASHIFFAITSIPPYSVQHTELALILLPFALFTAIYFLMNSWLVTLALALERGESAFPIWKTNFLWLSLNYFGSASVAALLVSYTPAINLTTLGVIIPLLVITYLTFRTSLGRLEDAQQHVEEVNRLYLSTIETLAMAIDAKDQVTHGHIRRVQQFALGLAEEFGVKDPGQLKALQAAALLHDTGKLVVPEHILNKPGKLTPGEFNKMKTHAKVGAEILSAINFPYPVVPIVRHHHECWDGSGYPDGLKGTEIPLGARILAVVDCFDALTSDRPYRRKLSDEDAMAILMQRRGTMYDPLIVDTFAAVKDRLAASCALAESQLEALLNRSPANPEPPSRPLAEVTLLMNSPVARTVQATLLALLESTQAKLAMFWMRDPLTDQLTTLIAVDRDGGPAAHTSIPVGTRISGWVAANGRAIVNADAALDLPELASAGQIARCLAVPVVVNQDVIGVLSVYIDDARGFSEHDLITVESAVSTIDVLAVRDLIGRVAAVRPIEASPTIH